MIYANKSNQSWQMRSGVFEVRGPSRYGVLSVEHGLEILSYKEIMQYHSKTIKSCNMMWVEI